jgi:hypothetical protein
VKTKATIFKIFLCSFCIICFGRSIAFAQKQPPIKKPDMWQSYSIKERDSLRARWTNEKVNKVVEALKTGKQLPDFVGILWHPEISDSVEKRMISGYDLQGITLDNKDLKNINLSSALLEGAHFNKSNLNNANLQKTHLENAYLQGADLIRANLQGAILDSANLQGANLQYANLEKAHLGYANLQKDSLFQANLENASLWYANLQGAYLYETNLQGAKLYHANLQRAKLIGTKLNEASLFLARFDTTDIWQTNLEDARNIRDIVWDSYYIYGEVWGDADTTAKGRKERLRNSEIEYRYLKNLYKKENMDEIAWEFHLRENEVHSKLSPWPVHALRTIFLNWTYGYGSRPIWLLWYTLKVIFLFWIAFSIQSLILRRKSGIYLGKVNEITENAENRIWTKRKWWAILDCLYFSILALCTFGYGALKLKDLIAFFKLKPLDLTPVRWARFLVGLEAALGIWLFALLATVLFGRG